jgi:predicted nucleic acid-binding protein
MIIIDTDIAIDVLRDFPAALGWLNSLPADESVVISGYTALELFAGSHNAAEQRSVVAMVNRFKAKWPTVAARERAMQDFRTLHLSNAIGTFDVLIAHTAIELGLPLHTFNVKHFQHVPGLTTIQPYTR